jgi:hypothetical protein
MWHAGEACDMGCRYADEDAAAGRAVAEADVSDDDVRRFYEASYAPRKLLVLDSEYVRHTKAGIAADRAYRAAQATPAEGAARPKPGTREHWRGPFCVCGHDALTHLDGGMAADCRACACQKFTATPDGAQPAGAPDLDAIEAHRDVLAGQKPDGVDLHAYFTLVDEDVPALVAYARALEQENATLREDAARLERVRERAAEINDDGRALMEAAVAWEMAARSDAVGFAAGTERARMASVNAREAFRRKLRDDYLSQIADVVLLARSAMVAAARADRPAGED